MFLHEAGEKSPLLTNGHKKYICVKFTRLFSAFKLEMNFFRIEIKSLKKCLFF